jgi:hypothetical protein
VLTAKALKSLARPSGTETGTGTEMKKVVSGGPTNAIAFPQADAGLPDTTFFISGPGQVLRGSQTLRAQEKCETGTHIPHED